MRLQHAHSQGFEGTPGAHVAGRPSRLTPSPSSGAVGRAIVPSGASTGRHEAIELRDAGSSALTADLAC